MRITSSYDATKLWVNHNTPEFVHFRAQLTAENTPVRSISTTTVLSQSTGVSDFTSGAVVISTIADLFELEEVGDFYVPAENVGIEGTGKWYYTSCKSAGCNKKLTYRNEKGLLVCSTCGKNWAEGTVRYRVVVWVLDKTGAPFLLWDRECADLVGLPASFLYTKYKKDDKDIPKQLEALIGMIMIFKISIKKDQIRNPTTAFTVMRVLSGDVLVATYCSRLKDEQDKDLISKMIEEDGDEDSDMRVTDMAFFAEDVHLLASASCNGRVYIWKITEGQDENGKPQITSQIVIAIQIVGEGESFHPRVCWHCHKQEILVVGIGERVLKIDTTKVGEGEVFSAIKPLSCPVDNLVEGVKLVGTHDGEVTDLSMSQGLTTFLVSASVDGTIKVWEDHKLIPIAVLRPHAGEPVNSVTFLAAPNNPDHIILITGGPLNREVKIWHSASEKGWLVPSDAESWHCTQTLELKTAETQVGEAFFNQVVAFSQAGLLLLANAKKNAIYAVHLEYGPNPAATRMDYIAEFAVSMPILSFIGKIGLLPNGEQIVLVYSVDTEDFQQYALDLSQCLPPASDNAVFERAESSASRDANIEGFSQRLPTEVTTSQESDTYSIEKAAQSIVDALWLCLQDESAKQEKVLRDQVSYMMGCIREESAKLENVLRNLLREESAKQEKLLRDHIQQVTNMISSSLKKEVSDIGPTAVEAVTRAESSTISRHRAESSTISRHRA